VFKKDLMALKGFTILNNLRSLIRVFLFKLHKKSMITPGNTDSLVFYYPRLIFELLLPQTTVRKSQCFQAAFKHVVEIPPHSPTYFLTPDITLYY